MCTVTYIPTAKGIYLTSNRDESAQRGRALPPAQYDCNGDKLIYPKDPDANGSWIALKQCGDAAVLLNGAFVRHERQPVYRKSRGLIFLEIMAGNNPPDHFLQIALDGIEPFTLVLFNRNQLWECRWDGYKKHKVLLNASRPYIWSSTTLYHKDVAEERRRWFMQWLSSASELNTAKIMTFHQCAGKGDLYNGLVINRENKMRTVSITSVNINADKPAMSYWDLEEGTNTVKILDPNSAIKDRGFLIKKYWFIRKLKIRIMNWEYWPSQLVYGPLYLYWLWLSLKARSFFFFSAANPGLQYAGFIHEKKSDIYPLIPQQYYPRTKLFKTGVLPIVVMEELKKEKLIFPLIAKPDIGEKGKQVKLLYTEDKLFQYISRSKVDFLIQEHIGYEQEAGIFYYRIPGEASGHISGIVGKEFLSVTGDGKSSIRDLLKREDRFLLQLPALQYTYGPFLDKVLAEGVRHILVPYGNHSRGAKFVDLKHKISDALISTIDAVCQQIPGFYYGRLDIRFNTWEELAEGKNFSIIELNGAGSEPTHMYDPHHSLFYAWKEICRHWKLMYQISRQNARHKKLPLMTTGEGIKMISDHRRYLKQIVKV